MQRCSTYNCANFARRCDCQSNSHILIAGQFVKNFVRWRPKRKCHLSQYKKLPCENNAFYKANKGTECMGYESGE